MSSKASPIIALLLSLNIALVSGCNTCFKPWTKPIPNPTPILPPATRSCPRDALKIGVVCAKVLDGPVNAVLGTPLNGAPCCSLLSGLVDLEVAACLCTAIKANILGINLNIPISLTLLINTCGKNLPSDFQCA